LDLLDFFVCFFEALGINFSNISTNYVGNFHIKGDAPMLWQVRRPY
jgi:hypothetical protein